MRSVTNVLFTLALLALHLVNAQAVVNGPPDETTGNVFGSINNFFGDEIGQASTTTPAAYPGLALGGYGPMLGSNIYDTGRKILTGSGVPIITPTWRGHYLDWTQFYYMGARYYDPLSGRFLSADPMGQAASWSLYDYCNGDPVNGLDPTGRCANQSGDGSGSNGPGPDGSFTYTDSNGNLGHGNIFSPYDLRTPRQIEDDQTNGLWLLTGLSAFLPAPEEVFGLAGAAGESLDEVAVLGEEASGARSLGEGGTAALEDTSVIGESIQNVGTDVSSAAEGTTTLYRAVMNPELDDILASGALRNPAGIESKYFSTSAEGAASYAKQAFGKFGDTSPYTLIQTEVPNSLLPGAINVDRGIQTIVLPGEALPGLVPKVLNSAPIPKL